MKSAKLLVIGNPGAPHLSVLSKLPGETSLTVSKDTATLAAAAPEADVILNCTGDGELLQPVWREARRVRWVHSLAAGVETQLFPELVESPVPLTNSRGVFRESLGEFVIAAALFFAKDLRRMLRSQAAERWDPFDVEELHRQTMGIVGYGEIGQAAGRRAKALGMTVYAVRRRPELSKNDPGLDESFPLNAMCDMMARCDYVVVAAPLTPETRGLVGDAEIRAMKRDAVMINVGRGPVIDEQALVRALEEKRIRGAALDVFETEPLPAGHAFWKLENVLLSPHCADHTADWLEQATEFFVANFERFSRGEQLLNVVDKKAGY